MIWPRKLPFSFLTKTTLLQQAKHCTQCGTADVTPSNPITAMHISLRFRCTSSIDMHKTRTEDTDRRQTIPKVCEQLFSLYGDVKCIVRLDFIYRLITYFFSILLFFPFLGSKCHSQKDTGLWTSLIPTSSTNQCPSSDADSHSGGQQFLTFNVTQKFMNVSE